MGKVIHYKRSYNLYDLLSNSLCNPQQVQNFERFLIWISSVITNDLFTSMDLNLWMAPRNHLEGLIHNELIGMKALWFHTFGYHKVSMKLIARFSHESKRDDGQEFSLYVVLSFYLSKLLIICAQCLPLQPCSLALCRTSVSATTPTTCVEVLFRIVTSQKNPLVPLKFGHNCLNLFILTNSRCNYLDLQPFQGKIRCTHDRDLMNKHDMEVLFPSQISICLIH